MSETRIPSPTEIEARRTPAGGWTKAQLAQWGVPWPPSKGWRQKLVREWKEQQAYTPELSKFLCQMEWSKETCSDLPCGLRSRCGALVAYMWRHSTVRVDTRRQ